MNSRYKSLAAAAIVLLIAAITCLAFFFTRDRYGEHSETQKKVIENKSFTADTKNIEKIKLDLEASPLTITAVQSNEPLTIQYQENNWYQYEIENSNGIVALKQTFKVNAQNWLDRFFNFFDRLNYNTGIEVKIPENYAGDLSIDATNGTIHMDGLNSVSILSCITTNSKIETTNITAKELFLKSTNGKMEAVNCTVDESMTIRTTNGKIEFSNISGKNLFFQTTNGKIEGIIRGNKNDYNIQSSTSNGSDSLENDRRNNGLDKNLETRTTNGSIDITFTEK